MPFSSEDTEDLLGEGLSKSAIVQSGIGKVVHMYATHKDEVVCGRIAHVPLYPCQSDVEGRCPSSYFLFCFFSLGGMHAELSSEEILCSTDGEVDSSVSTGA